MTKYKDLGKRTGGGLGGWNCRHSFITFDPETMKLWKIISKNMASKKTKKYMKIIKTALQKAQTHEKSSLNLKYIHYKQLVTKWNKEQQNNLKVQIDRTKI